MVALPIPQRWVLKLRPGLPWINLVADVDVVVFVNTLAPVTLIVPSGSHLKDQYDVWIDERYAPNHTAMQQVVAWIEQELRVEFGSSAPPAKPQMDVP